MAKKISFSNANLELREISENFKDTELALRRYYNVSNEEFHLYPKFFAYSQQEINAELHKRIDELNKSTTLTVLASIEASFQIDYLKRCYGRKRDSLSKDFRLIYIKNEQENRRTSLEEDILKNWKKHFPDSKSLISKLIEAFNYRHWLAHGRYWQHKLGRKYDYDYIYELGEEIYKSLPLEKQIK